MGSGGGLLVVTVINRASFFNNSSDFVLLYEVAVLVLGYRFASTTASTCAYMFIPV